MNRYHPGVYQKRYIIATICVFCFVVGSGFSFWWLKQRISNPLTMNPVDPVLEDISLPEGFSIQYYARGLKGARSMTVSPFDVVYVGSRNEGNIYAITPKRFAPTALKTYVVASNLNSPNGVAWHDGNLYVAENDRVIVFEGIDSNFARRPAYTVVRDDLPEQSTHGWKYLRVGQDNRLYVSIGAPCNVCVSSNPLHGSLSRMELDGSNWQIIASGIRNTVGFDWHPQTRELWFTDNGRDGLGDDLPGDELNKITALRQHYGFPYCHNDDILDPEFGADKNCSNFVAPEQVLGPHVAALGMRFYTGAQFPQKYSNTAFIAEHGSWNRSEPIGYRITTVSFDESGDPRYDVFADGWLSDGAVSGRPVDVLQLRDGSLLISDDHAGAIYRISYSATIIQ